MRIAAIIVLAILLQCSPSFGQATTRPAAPKLKADAPAHVKAAWVACQKEKSVAVKKAQADLGDTKARIRQVIRDKDKATLESLRETQKKQTAELDWLRDPETEVWPSLSLHRTVGAIGLPRMVRCVTRVDEATIIAQPYEAYKGSGGVLGMDDVRAIQGELVGGMMPCNYRVVLLGIELPDGPVWYGKPVEVVAPRSVDGQNLHAWRPFSFSPYLVGE